MENISPFLAKGISNLKKQTIVKYFKQNLPKH